MRLIGSRGDPLQNHQPRKPRADKPMLITTLPDGRLAYVTATVVVVTGDRMEILSAKSLLAQLVPAFAMSFEV